MDKCTGNYSVLRTFKQEGRECVGKCEDLENNVYWMPEDSNRGQCIYSCASVGMYTLESKCVSDCPSTYFVRTVTDKYTPYEREVFSCVEKCPDSRTRIVVVNGLNECLEPCAFPREYTMPDGSCTSVCPLEYGELEGVCLKKCQDGALYEYSFKKQHYVCSSSC